MWLAYALIIGFCAAHLTLSRLVWHPLSAVPGPRLAALSSFYELWHNLDGKFMFFLRDLHAKYGPIVRIGPNEIHVSNPQWASEILATNAERDKEPSLAGVVGTTRAFATVPHGLHRARRAAIAPLFTRHARGQFEIQAHVNRLSNFMLRKNGQALELRTLTLAWASDALLEEVIGCPLNLIADEKEASSFFEHFSGLDVFFPWVKQFPFVFGMGLALPRVVADAVLPGALSRFLNLYKAMRVVAANIISGNKDFKIQSKIVSSILDSGLNLSEKTSERIADEMFEVLGAGSNTTAKVATNAVYHLCCNDECRAQLLHELDGAIPDAQIIPPIEVLEKLPYLTAVVHESIRISTLLASRTSLISPSNHMRFGNTIIPPGTAASVSLSWGALDERWFPDAHRFDPGRWLQSHEITADLLRKSLPFSRGPRMCLGESFALMQLYTVIATLMRRFEFQLVDVQRARDIDHSWGGFMGEPSVESRGVWVRAMQRTTGKHSGSSG